MTKNQVIREIKNARKCFVGTVLFADEIYYVEVTKKELLRVIDNIEVTGAEYILDISSSTGNVYFN